MSSFFISPNDPKFGQEIASRLAFTADATTWSGSALAGSYALARVDQEELWSPAEDVETSTSVIIGGRLAISEDQWKHAETLPMRGGLAARLILDAWKSDSSGLTALLNGAAAVAIFDPDSGLHLFTDCLGAYPVFLGSNGFLCSHPDVLAEAMKKAGTPVEIDHTSLAECIATGTTSQPHSYWKQIRMLEPGAHYTWSGRETIAPSQEFYWQPAFPSREESDDTIVADLASALKTAVKLRTNPRFGNTLVMLSGGADSRLALFCADSPSNVDCVSVCDEPNAETETAAALAKAAGASHEILRRTPDYYGENAERAVRVGAGMHSLIDAHFAGFRDQLMGRDPGVMLTGCYADYLLKGLSLNRRYKRLFGKALPVYRQSDFSFQYYHPHCELGEAWQSRVMDRLGERYREELRGQYHCRELEMEDLRIRPLAREADSLGRMHSWRTLPWDPFFADAEIADVCARMSARQKRNGIVFSQAVARAIGPVGSAIRNNNYGTRLDAGEFGRITGFLVGVVKRKLGLEKSGGTSGSWPNWHQYAESSEAIQRLWSSPSSADRQFLTEVMGDDPWKTEVAEWARHRPLVFLRLLTVKIWLGQQNH
ncbi:MAG: hypothetical protein CMO80_09305 [Verrucomicrobiales bacterium]|nr:hypothetical protein [Verrucomicrobiales bacterium]